MSEILQKIKENLTKKETLIAASTLLGSLLAYKVFQQKKQRKPEYVIPLIDLQDKDAAKKIRQACENQGFFYIINHGIPEEEINQVFEQSKLFFSLPFSEKIKLKATLDNYHRGYTAYQQENIGRKKHGDTKEGFHIGVHADIGSYENKNFEYYGPNVFPEVNQGGKDFSIFRPSYEGLYNKMRDLGLNLTQLIATSLDLDKNHFDKLFTNPMATLRVVRYPGVVSVPEEGIMSCGEHTDGGIITILKTDQEPGLQIQLDGKWVDVVPIKNAFIINLGMTLQRWTNDTFKATRHRVINWTGRERYSMPFFYLPNYDIEIKCIPTFITKDQPEKYPPVKFSDYFFGRISKSYEKDFQEAKKKEANQQQ